LRSLIEQLLVTANLSGHIGIFDDDSSTKFEPTLWKILEKIVRVSGLSTIYCIIDAMDECKDRDSRERLISGIKGLLQTCQKERSFPVLKLFITSRPILDISRELDQFPYIDLKANPDDLKIFIESKVKALNHFSADLQKSAAEMLLGRAERTFLWASIVLKKLKTMPFVSLALLRDIIEDSPTDLDELYLSITNHIMEGTQLEQKLLAWVVYGRRPLTLQELEAALATQLESQSKASTDKYRIDLTTEAVTSAAGVILEITDDKRVHLIHQSAKDFLIKSQQLNVAKFCNDLSPNIYLAKVCMVYLCFEDFETGPCSNRESLMIRRREYPLLDYAARNWHTHIQNGDDIKGISNILSRLTKPLSPTLLSWGEAAEIPTLNEAVDMWGIATKTNILWLVEFQSQDTIVDEERVLEAANSGLRGYDIMEALIKRGDVQFTEAAVQALATYFNERIMQLLLEKNSIKVTHALVKATAANQNYGDFVMRLLLESLDEILLTADLVNVIARNKERGNDIMELLLRKQGIQIADSAMVAMVKIFDAKVLRLLPYEQGAFRVTEKVFDTITTGDINEEKMIILLERCGNNIEITERMIQDCAKLFSEEVMTLLLNQRRDEVKITEEVIKAAARNPKSSKAIIRLLLDERGDEVKITEEVVKAAAGYPESGEEIMRLLLHERGDEVKITEEVIKAAAGNPKSGVVIMGLLLNEHGDEVKITKEVVKAAAGNPWRGKEIMRLLLHERGDEVKITEEVIKAAAGNPKSGVVIMGLLLNEHGDEVKITEEVFKTAAGNPRRGKEIMKLLLNKRGDKVKVTKEIVKAAAGNPWRGEEIMKLLLNKRGDEVKVTEEVVKAAAGNPWRGEEIMKLLLNKRGDEVKVTKEVFKAAAGNPRRGEEIMKLLLNKRGDEVKVTEEVVKAAAGNPRRGEEIIKLLLDKRGDEVKITEEVVKAAVGNPSNGEAIIRLLLDKRGDEVKITEEVVKAAAGSGEAIIRMFLDKRGDEVKITKEVVKAAAGNFLNGEAIMRLLLDKRGDEVKITDEVVKAAAGSGAAIIRLLLDKRSDEVKITKEVVEAAARNH
jgi:formylmethanofuran dehydrogenase subunit D